MGQPQALKTLGLLEFEGQPTGQRLPQRLPQPLPTNNNDNNENNVSSSLERGKTPPCKFQLSVLSLK